MVVKRGGKWYVKSTTGKNLGGPYDSKAAAVKRLRQVEYFKHHEGDSVRDLLGIRAHTEGSFRTEKFGGRDYMVVPVVALVEGVIHGVTAEYPELALASEFGKFPAGWNGRPVVMDHPEVIHDNQKVKVSANSPSILEKYQFGFLFNSRMDGTRLLTEAWIDVERANKLNDNSKQVITALQAGKPWEVSTGLFTGVHKVGGYRGAERYEAVWEGVVPDHLAFLPEGSVGACSLEDGCGAARQNSQYVTLRANCDGNYDPVCGCTTPTVANAEGKVVGRTIGMIMGDTTGDNAGSVTAPGDPAEDTSNVDTGKNKRGKKKKTTTTGTMDSTTAYQAHEFDPEEFLQQMLANQGVPEGMMDSDVRCILRDELCEMFPDAYPYVVGFTPSMVVYSLFDSIDSGRYTYQAPFTIDDATKEAEIDATQAVEVTLTTTITPAVEDDESAEGDVSAMAGNPASADNTSNTENSMTTAPKPGDTPAASPTTHAAPVAPAASSVPQPPAASVTSSAEPAAASPPAPAPQIRAQTADEYINSAPAGVREALQSAMRTHEAQKASAIAALKATSRCSFSDSALSVMSLEDLERLVQLAAVPNYSGQAPAQAPRTQSSFSGFAPPPPRLGDKAAAVAAPASTATH